MSATRRKAARAALVEWRGGVHVVGTPLWCDAPRGRDACFVSAADVPGAHRHRQLIATEATLKLLPERPRGTVLATPYGRPFTLGNLRVELFPSGHAAGAASLAVDVGGARVVHAGAIAPARAEVRACDALVLDAMFAHPRYRFPPAEEVEARLAAWVAETTADGATAVLLARPLACGPGLARLLAGRATLRAHRAFVDTARRLRALGEELPPLRRFEGTPAAGDVVLWPLEAADARAVAPGRRLRRALVDGHALDPAVVARLGIDAAFPLADRAGHDELLEYARQAGAREVHLVGGPADELAAALATRGIAARPLGPPRQLSLF